MKKIVTIILLVVLGLITAFAVFLSRPRPELIALGDSITESTINYGRSYLGFRGYLQDELGLGAYNFKGQFQNSGFSIHQRRHSGVSGETIAQIKKRLPGNLMLFGPQKTDRHHVILIHAGTNDLRNTIKDDDHLQKSLKVYGEMLTAIHEYNPNIDIYVAGLIPSAGQPCERNVTAFNPRLAAMVESKGYPNLHYVDMNAAFKNDTFGLCKNEWPKYCMADSLHPSKIGYKVMAKQWAACIKDPKAKNCNGH